MKLTIKYNELTAEEFIFLWQAVHLGDGPTLEQTKLAMDHTLFRISIYDGKKIIAMARMIGDIGLDFYIKDVVVIPEYQGKGIGTEAIKFVTSYYKDWNQFTLITPMDKTENIKFYTEKCGFKIVSTETDGNVKVVRFILEKEVYDAN